MSNTKLSKKERTPIIAKRDLAYQEFLDGDQVKSAIERIIASTWEQALNTAAVVLELHGHAGPAVIIRQIRRPG